MTVWMSFIFPLMWFIILPFNYLLDSLVLYLTMKKFNLKEKKHIYKGSILKICIWGFISKCIGVAILFIPIIINNVFNLDANVGQGLFYFVINELLEVTVNPFGNIYSFILTTLAILISCMFIYLFNYNYSLKKIFKDKYISEVERKKIALSIAIFTAPYLFYLPIIYY